MERVGEIRVLLLRSYFLYGALPSVVGMLLVTSTFLWPEFQKIATYIWSGYHIWPTHRNSSLEKWKKKRSRASFHQNCYAIAMACSFACFHHFKCLDICFQRDILGASWPKNDQAPAESAGKLRMWGMLGAVGIWDVYYLIYIYIYIIIIYVCVFIFICIYKYMCVVCKYIYMCVCVRVYIHIYIFINT